MAMIRLDSHALMWFIDGNARLSLAARNAIQDPGNIVYVGAVTR
jgi:PIN domain nuclease of toxin-antitoxin system